MLLAGEGGVWRLMVFGGGLFSRLADGPQQQPWINTG
jgi:hypothetical protein